MLILCACTMEQTVAPTPPAILVARERITPTQTRTPTVTPIPSAIPVTMATATATATPTAINTSGPLLYQPVLLDSIVNASLSEDFIEPLTGNQILNDVPFSLNGWAFKSQARPSPNNTYPTNAVLEVNLPYVEHVYVLLTAGNGFTRWQNEPVGRIIIVFDTGALIEVDLVLGLNLREWHAVGDVVSYAPSVQQVWEGAITGHPHLRGTMDMLEIEVPSEYHEKTVVQIEFYDTSTFIVDSLDPALTISGITVAYRSDQ
jgi:hypothetical protein